MLVVILGIALAGLMTWAIGVLVPRERRCRCEVSGDA